MTKSKPLGIILVAFGLLILAVIANWGEVLGPGPMAEREPLPLRSAGNKKQRRGSSA